MTDSDDAGPIGIALTDDETGEQITPEQFLRRMKQLDPQAIKREACRRIDMMILPYSLFFAGSAFRKWVAQVEDQYGERPVTVLINGVELPLPERWPDDPYWTVPRENYAARYYLSGSNPVDWEIRKYFRTTYPELVAPPGEDV